MSTTDQQYLKMLQTRAAYNAEGKEDFHRAAKTMLQRLAKRLDHGGYGGHDPIRSNKGGIAVGGEITLHFDRLYVQVSQPVGMGMNAAILVRSCLNRKDYTGGQNHFLPMDLLIETELLARRIEHLIPMRMGLAG